MAEHKRACSDSCHRHRRGWITSVQLADNLMARRGKSEPNHLLRTHTSCAPQPVNVANWKCHQVRTRYTDVVQPQTVALFFFPLPRLCVPLRVTWQGSREKGKVTGFSEETMVQVTLMHSPVHWHRSSSSDIVQCECGVCALRVNADKVRTCTTLTAKLTGKSGPGRNADTHNRQVNVNWQSANKNKATEKFT